MNKLLGVLFVVLSLFGCASHPPPVPPTHEEMAAQLADLTVALVKPDDDGEEDVFCSGVWLSKDTIVTAAHCTRNREEFRYKSCETCISLPASLKMRDEAHDLALLKAKDETAHGWANLGGLPVPGQRVLAMGHSMGMTWSFSSGDVAAIRVRKGSVKEPITWIQTTAPTSPGNSGCGLWSEDGRLLGIASHIVQLPMVSLAENVNFYVPVQYLP